MSVHVDRAAMASCAAKLTDAVERATRERVRKGRAAAFLPLGSAGRFRLAKALNASCLATATPQWQARRGRFTLRPTVRHVSPTAPRRAPVASGGGGAGRRTQVTRPSRFEAATCRGGATASCGRVRATRSLASTIGIGLIRPTPWRASPMEQAPGNATNTLATAKHRMAVQCGVACSTTAAHS